MAGRIPQSRSLESALFPKPPERPALDARLLERRALLELRWRCYDRVCREHLAAVLPHCRFVYDIGCGVGVVMTMLQKFGHAETRFFGVDVNPQLIGAASELYLSEYVDFRATNVAAYAETVRSGGVPAADLIWCSMSLCYMERPDVVLQHWVDECLSPLGFLVLVEADGLFSVHSPMSVRATRDFERIEARMQEHLVYDPWMGRKIEELVREIPALQVYRTGVYSDEEFGSLGPAREHVRAAWDRRLSDPIIVEEVGLQRAKELRREFLQCISRKDHNSEFFMKFVLARKREEFS